MTAGVIIGLVAQLTAIVLLAVGFCHEKEFVAFEDRFIRRLKRGLRKRLASWLNTPVKNTLPVQCPVHAPVIRSAGVFEDFLSAEQLREIKLDACSIDGEQNIVA